ncbi:YhdT family protein [Sinanaerobacter chloroacetimidivorans]|jgi:uncharacterized membrane protein YhdT|uniref:YhdT family protein n=1 Tax=Sinanaerobacter chloroacetimidivorans TaxID=2818044 RepID=A0A8J8B1Y4_9FIRM|nr:YhdT family protein [Sinanaerobacter chloroacetimidivorans]MBR0596710.1 YhdT family protein [Sinanaerobacter chloroacetimidivorans]
MKLSEKDRNRQMNKEALWSIGLYVVFFLWWYFTGYGIGEATSPADYTYVMGLPLWFFLSCVMGWVLTSVGVIILVKVIFKDFDLDSDDKSDVN